MIRIKESNTGKNTAYPSGFFYAQNREDLNLYINSLTYSTLYSIIKLNSVQNSVQQEDKMKNSEDVRQKIIDVTIDLINNSNGAIEAITTRAIAEKASIGVGLINYYFQTKENLIEICVQRIIGTVITKFKPAANEKLNVKDRLKSTAKEVADFLIENPSVSRISILSDHIKPQIFDNTMKSVQGFLLGLGDSDMSDRDKKILVFAMTSVLQALFLRRELSKELFQLDFSIKQERDIFIDIIIDNMFGG